MEFGFKRHLGLSIVIDRVEPPSNEIHDKEVDVTLMLGVARIEERIVSSRPLQRLPNRVEVLA